MNALAAAVLAAGELICDFSDAQRRNRVIMIYEAVTNESAQVVSSARAGRRPVQVSATREHLHLIEPDGSSVRVTTLTQCTRTRRQGEDRACTRFAARHAWHFDAGVYADPDAAFQHHAAIAAAGVCEPWKID